MFSLIKKIFRDRGLKASLNSIDDRNLSDVNKGLINTHIIQLLNKYNRLIVFYNIMIYTIRMILLFSGILIPVVLSISRGLDIGDLYQSIIYYIAIVFTCFNSIISQFLDIFSIVKKRNIMSKYSNNIENEILSFISRTGIYSKYNDYNECTPLLLNHIIKYKKKTSKQLIYIQNNETNPQSNNSEIYDHNHQEVVSLKAVDDFEPHPPIESNPSFQFKLAVPRDKADEKNYDDCVTVDIDN